MIAILPFVRRVLSRAALHGGTEEGLGPFITYQGDTLDMRLTWERESGYDLALSPSLKGAGGSQAVRHFSEAFTSPAEFERVLSGLLSAKRELEVRRPRRRHYSAR